MFRSKTLFVVGAGASFEVGLPTGADLKHIIAVKLDIRFDRGRGQISGDPRLAETLSRYSRDTPQADFNVYRSAACQIAAAMPQALSIDNYIDAHRHDPNVAFCGKLVIAECILEAEKGSKLWFDENHVKELRLEALNGTWFTAFFQRLTEGVSKADVDGIFDNLSIITFNYDRCIEHFLANSLAAYYAMPTSDAQRLAARLVVYHPYGKVGLLPWQASPDRGIQFGGSIHGEDDLVAIAQQLKTFTESVEEGDQLKEMRQRVQDAETIVFLGFAFAEQNMTLIAPPKPTATKRVFATAFGMSSSDGAVIRGDIAALLDRSDLYGTGTAYSELDLNVRIDKTCTGLFAEYQRSITR